MLSPSAQQLVYDYLNLPFAGIVGVRCPYFNNAHLKQRAQLRVLVGKGTPREIVEEAKIISIQYHSGPFDKAGHCCLHGEHGQTAPEEIRQFLIDHNLGIECSGFVTQVLRAHFKETRSCELTKKLFIVSPRNLLRWLITRLRPIENIGVNIYADDRNTQKLSDWRQAQPADVLVLLSTGARKKFNHIILITGNTGQVITYVHARAWSDEGKYGHGVAEGEIRIINPNGGLLDQEWVELGRKGEDNETFLDARDAAAKEIRRLKW